MQFVSVLKLGIEYREIQAYLLADSLVKHNPGARLTLLTDSKEINHPHIDVIPLIHSWDGWWSKIELFRKGLFNGPVLYMDLDTVVVDKIDFIKKPIKSFCMLRDVYNPNSLEKFGSGIMYFDGRNDYSNIYTTFAADVSKYIAEYRTGDKWGDQAFIYNHLQEHAVPIDQIFSRKFLSYKVHCIRGVPREAAVVFFHGKPRPWEIRLKLSR